VPTATLAPATTPAPLATGAENVITVDTIRGTVITFENLGDRFTIDNRAYLTEYGVFVRLTFEAENIGKTVSSLAIRQMMDSQERVFPPYNEIFVKDYCRGSLTLAPNLPAKCMMVYEVPPDAEEFTVTFSSGGSEQVLLLGTPES
jgi:hypothetical protein